MAAFAKAEWRPPALAQRLEGVDWQSVEAQLDGWGHATTGPLLTPEEARRGARLVWRCGPLPRRAS